MFRLALLLVLLTNLSFGQKDTAYQLYEHVINDFINDGLEQNIRTNQVVIISKLMPEENWASEYGNHFLGSDDRTIAMWLRYDSAKIELIRDYNVREALMSLEKEFYETPTLDKNSFSLEPTTYALSHRRFKRFFKSIFEKKIDKGWKKFYKRYPGSYGVFAFSKVVFSGNYACFYTERRSNGLSARGDLVIAKRIDTNWALFYLNIWMA